MDISADGDVNLLLSLFIPFTIGISVLRYRLFDIDLIIRKTLVYAVVTGLLTLVYFGVVVLLQGVFSSFGAGKSQAVIILSTLLIATLFTPLRRWVQARVDRHFFRTNYNAQKTLEHFAAQVRDEVELEKISAYLQTAVQETLQPEHVSLWLRKQPK
jgi:hypothetical protein